MVLIFLFEHLPGTNCTGPLVLLNFTGDLPSVRITCSDHEHGVDPPLFVQTVLNEVHFRCASGFELVGQRISTCVSTGWDHELPSCRELPKTTLSKYTSIVFSVMAGTASYFMQVYYGVTA